MRSTADHGSTFAFYISTRVAKPPLKAAVASGEKPKRPVPTHTMSTEEAMKAAQLNILIVEDNLVNQKVLSKQLEKVGCRVSIAGHGIEALKWLQESVYWRGERKVSGAPDTGSGAHDIDIVLMDIEMPVMDGMVCTRQIRSLEAQGLLAPPPPPPLISGRTSSSAVGNSFTELSLGSRRLPILAVSANARSEQVKQALAAGMDDAIAKPFRVLELWPKMCKLVPRCAGLYGS